MLRTTVKVLSVLLVLGMLFGAFDSTVQVSESEDGEPVFLQFGIVDDVHAEDDPICVIHPELCA